MEKELRFLRNKVQQLETTIEFIQNEVQDKLNLILERFFVHRVDQLTKQKRAIQLEEDVCRNLLSCCSRLAEDEDASSEGHASDAGSPAVKPRKRKRKANRSSRTSSLESGTSTQPQDQSGSENDDSFLEQSDPNLPSGSKLPIDSDRILESEERDSNTSDVDEFRMTQVKMEIVDDDDTQANNGDQSQKDSDLVVIRSIEPSRRSTATALRQKRLSKKVKPLKTNTRHWKVTKQSGVWKSFNVTHTGDNRKKIICECKTCGSKVNWPKVERLKKHILACEARTGNSPRNGSESSHRTAKAPSYSNT